MKAKRLVKKSSRNRIWDQEERKEKEEDRNSRTSMVTCQQKQSTMDTYTKWGYGWRVCWIL
jgi:hypothetical protein